MRRDGSSSRAWTDPRHLPHWMIGPPGWTMPVCEIDLRPGGSWHFVWRKADGSEMGMRGEYREILPPERLVWTESWGADWPETLNTLVLTERDGRTPLTSTLLYRSKEARDAAFKTGIRTVPRSPSIASRSACAPCAESSRRAAGHRLRITLRRRCPASHGPAMRPAPRARRP